MILPRKRLKFFLTTLLGRRHRVSPTSREPYPFVKRGVRNGFYRKSASHGQIWGSKEVGPGPPVSPVSSSLAVSVYHRSPVWVFGVAYRQRVWLGSWNLQRFQSCDGSFGFHHGHGKGRSNHEPKHSLRTKGMGIKGIQALFILGKHNIACSVSVWKRWRKRAEDSE
jgi:hypothetical protein